MSFVDHIYIYFMGYIVTALITWIGASLYLAHSLRQKIIEHMKNSTLVILTAPDTSQSQWKKFIWINNVASYITHPVFYIKRGELCSSDIQNLPKPIKRKLVALRWAILGLVMCIAMYFVFRTR